MTCNSNYASEAVGAMAPGSVLVTTTTGTFSGSSGSSVERWLQLLSTQWPRDATGQLHLYTFLCSMHSRFYPKISVSGGYAVDLYHRFMGMLGRHTSEQAQQKLAASIGVGVQLVQMVAQKMATGKHEWAVSAAEIGLAFALTLENDELSNVSVSKGPRKTKGSSSRSASKSLKRPTSAASKSSAEKQQDTLPGSAVGLVPSPPKAKPWEWMKRSAERIKPAHKP